MSFSVLLHDFCSLILLPFSGTIYQPAVRASIPGRIERNKKARGVQI